jgi:hypothetical protein
MRLLVIDPGKMSGWFCIDFSTLSWVGGEKSHDELLDWLEPQPHAYSSSPLMLWHLDRVLMEGFKVGPRTYQTNPTDAELWSVKQIGVVEMWCRRLGIPFQTQMPSAMKFDESGAKLKKLGWYRAMDGVTGEAGHRRAAAKHALKWGVDHHILDLETLL